MRRDILLLGNPLLYEASAPVAAAERRQLGGLIADLHDTLIAFRQRYGTGRAIAAPQIGVRKRLIYMYIDGPVAFINPAITPLGDDTMDVMDDCMSFPGLAVRVRRHARCRIDYLDLDWQAQSMELEGDLAELLQHECDHLDGILATMRAIDTKSFFFV